MFWKVPFQVQTPPWSWPPSNGKKINQSLSFHDDDDDDDDDDGDDNKLLHLLSDNSTKQRSIGAMHNLAI